MRPALALVCALVLSACTADAPADTTPLTDADRLLDGVTPAAFAPAFDALATRNAIADFQVTTDSGGTTTGEATIRLQFTARGVRVLRQSGALAEADDGPPRLRNPVASALPDDPPYADPASRDQYRRRIVGDTVVAGRRLRVVEATLIDPQAEQGVRRVRAAVDPETRQPVVVTVDRAAKSAVYDEQSRVLVELAEVGGTWLPVRVETDVRTDVPLSPARHVRTAWTVRSVNGRPLFADRIRKE